MPRTDYIQREKTILEAIIKAYIRTGRPVSSRAVAGMDEVGQSPATVRNVMSVLTDKGMLDQPHVSAGRIPTLAGMRYYLRSFLTLERLDSHCRESIINSLMDSGPDFNATLRQASRVLSSFSNQVAMIMSPAQAAATWKQIDFVLLKPGLVMSVLVLEGGLISNRMIETEKKLSGDELIYYSNYLNEHFQGKTVSEIRKSIVRQLRDAPKNFENLYLQALYLARNACEDALDRELFVDGATKVLNNNRVDISQLKDLLDLLEEKSKLLTLLDGTIKASDIRVFFAEDHGLTNLSNYGFISSPYGPENNALGSVGVIGPVHMNYPRLIPTVDLVAQILTQLFQKNS